MGALLLKETITPDICIAKMHTTIQESQKSVVIKGELHIEQEQL
jgi:hypothetical protein